MHSEQAHQDGAAELDQPRSRKLVLAGGLGAIGAWFAGRWLTDDAQAANGQPILQGRKNTGRKETAIQMTGASKPGLRVGAKAIGVLGQSTASMGTGVKGESPAGLGVRGASSKGTGIRGQSSQGRGVWGSSKTGVGVVGQSTSGPALRALGNVQLQSAGTAVVSPTAKTVGVFPTVPVNEGSFVVATLASDPGNDSVVHYCAVDAAGDTFALHLTKPPTVNTVVAWFLMETAIA